MQENPLGPLLMDIYLNEFDYFIYNLNKKIQKLFKFEKQQNNKIHNKLHYVRSANNYIIAIKGSKLLAKDIQKQSQNFLKFNLDFELKEKNFIYTKDNKIELLKFDIKILKEKRKTILKSRKILNLKKIKNRLISRKNTMESRFEKTIFKIYKARKLKFLKLY